MSAHSPITNRAITFGYKVQRKLRRELRKRFADSLFRWDDDQLKRAMKGMTARSMLLDFTTNLSKGWPDEWENQLTCEEAEKLIGKADDACSHFFDLLGSGRVFLGEKIDWHKDFKTGFRWPENVHHLNIAWDAVPPGTDIKVPWELSRCQHLIPLALAHRITSEDRYYQEFKSQVLHWIDSNPCGYGVNWVCAMDVAIRAVNWLMAAIIFHESLTKDEDSEFPKQLVESLWRHGRHIMRNLEWQGPRSASLANHFLANLCGLLAVGTLFRHSTQGKHWLDFSHRWFENEILRQVFDDGSLYETSTSYHRLSLEMFLWADTITAFIGKSFSASYQERLSAMCDFVASYTTPDGTAAQFGDNDSGRLLALGIGPENDHRYLTSGECGFGGKGQRSLFRGGRSIPPSRIRNAFPDGGYWFGRAGDAWLGIRAGKISHGGAHAHADQLQFVLGLAGENVIVDPGTGTYSADVEQRNLYRSSTSHNAPRLNEWEPNEFQTGMAGLFRMTDDTGTRIKHWKISNSGVLFEGSHHGYVKNRPDCICTRILRLNETSLTIIDEFSNLRKGDRIDWHFCLASNADAIETPEGIKIRTGSKIISFECSAPSSCSLEKTSYSPGYGREEPASAIHVSRTVTDPENQEFIMHMKWETC